MLEFLGLTVEELCYCAVIAFFVTWFILNAIKIKRILKMVSEGSEAMKDTKQILERCYTLFPLDSISFHGRQFKRGMRIKITTRQNKTFEGEFIGTNNRNLVCIMTNKLVVAHEMNNISDITSME